MWEIHETYFGIYENHEIIAYCDDFHCATLIVDSLLIYHKDRPFSYRIQHSGLNHKDFEDVMMYTDLFGEIVDNSRYFKEQYC